MATIAEEYGISGPLVSDEGAAISNAYGVMRWATPGGKPGHTFVLVDRQGIVKWIQDYGAEENGGRMYVPVAELVAALRQALNAP